MSLNVDEDILRDFLVDADEILEQLGEQLLELEKRPQDEELLNAVFRGFHTIKGGAGFLNLDSLVAVCHRAEDVFNRLRQGKRKTDPELMDVILQVLDVVRGMFAQLHNLQAPTPAEPELLGKLDVLARRGASPAPASPAPEPPQPDVTDADFQAMLAKAQGEGDAPAAETPSVAAPPATAVEDDKITDDEFESLLDQLHGDGRAPIGPSTKPAGPPKPAAAPADPATGNTQTAPESSAKADSDDVPRPRAAANKPPRATQEATVRVDTRRLDEIMNLVGELVLVRNRLATLSATLRDESVSKAIANLDVVTSDLQAKVMMTRMQPIKKVFGRFPRVVRDLARNLCKDVRLEMRGEDTELDKNLVEALADPLVHLVRNAVDHGIEDPNVRIANDKPREGRLILSAEQEGDHILLVISDDGRGMDADQLRRKAVERGLVDADGAARMSRQECFNLIFLPGLSTKEEISDVSGRGVGMDVVKTRIAQLNGRIEIDSELHRGTEIRIKVPLTLAILPTLMVVVCDRVFAIPLVCINEILPMEPEYLSAVDGRCVLRVRGKPLPLLYLRRCLAVGGNPEDDRDDVGHVVVIGIGEQKIGFVVDDLIGQEEVVIKPLSTLLQGLPGFAGATITGDGGIALILDVPGVVRAYGDHAGRVRRCA